MNPRPASIAVRLVGLALASVFVAQAVVESGQWLNGNEASRRTYLLMVALVVALLTATTLRLAARRGRVGGMSLASGAVGGLAAGASWTAIASAGPTMPRDAAGGLALIAVFAAVAAGSVRGRGVRDRAAAALVAGAAGTALVFSVAELVIQDFPARIPDIVGPVMPAGSTAQQVLVENRIEIVDGYVVLLFLLVALLAGLLAVSAPGQRDDEQAWASVAG